MTGHTPAQKERLVLIMKKTYKIEVDCANCAQKMEDADDISNGHGNPCRMWRKHRHDRYHAVTE